MSGAPAGDGPVVAISGASKGLGLALVDHFLDRGWRVAGFARSETPEIAARRADVGAERLFWRDLDATEGEALRGFARDAARAFGGLDALVNNAGAGFDGLLATMREEEVDRLLDVNLRAAILLSQACARQMLRRGAGAIVNVTSVNAIRGHAGVSVYSATKAALDGFTRSLARELGPRAIRVNAVAPGYFASDMVAGLDDAATQRIARRTPLGRLAEPEEICRAVHFLASGDAAFVTGQTLAVDGGLTC